MSRAPKSVYACTACGAQSGKWVGQCPDCGAWNTLQESVAAPAPAAGRFAGYAGSGEAVVRTLASVASAGNEARLTRKGALRRPARR